LTKETQRLLLIRGFSAQIRVKVLSSQLISATLLSKMSFAMQQPIWNFEQEPFIDERPDETSINLRAYLDRIDDEKMRQYQHSWTDEQLIDWCGDFRDDGALMIACCERDVDVSEFRRVLEQAIAYRDRVRPALVETGK
jgi:hypothetical protein